jgi:predicted nucleic-acid-binding Zn-ribbon protein
LDGAGCTECGIITKKNSMTLTTDEFISRSNIVHNNKYDYTKVIYTGALNHVVIICEKHGEFLQTPTTHTNVASGCPRCSTRGYSKQQIAWLKFMSLYYNIDIQHAENGGEYKVENIKADGFCRETGEIYEYHGDFWHGNPARYNPQSMNVMVKKTFGELYQKTIEREQRIIDLGFKLVTIWETEWLNLNKFVKILQMRFRRSRDTRQT